MKNKFLKSACVQIICILIQVVYWAVFIEFLVGENPSEYGYFSVNKPRPDSYYTIILVGVVLSRLIYESVSGLVSEFLGCEGEL